MADVIPITTNGAGPAPPPSPFPRRTRPKLTIEDQVVIDSALLRSQQILDDRDRGLWNDARLQRYAKYRGWLPEKNYPWPRCSNVHLPILQTAELRANAGLHNVVMTLRPLVAARATKRTDVPKEDRITNLLDTQLFLDPGPEQAERRFGAFVDGGLQDGNAVAYTPWVRDERTVTKSIYRPGVPAGTAPADYIDQLLVGTAQKPGLFPGAKAPELDDTLDYRFRVTYREGIKDKEAQVDVYSDADGDLELCITREATIYDGPVMLPWPIEGVLVPTRCTNLQPPSEHNPTGAAYVFLLGGSTLDEVRRLKGNGQFNWLTDETLKAIETEAYSRAGVLTTYKPEEELARQKDALEGREHREPVVRHDDDLGHVSVDLLFCFDRWDVNGDGLKEDVFWVIARDAKVLCEARLLTERWPADNPYRPLAEWCPLPVKDRWYGISLLELGESIYDLVKGTFDLAYDSSSITTLPAGFYAASSKMQTETISIVPGQLTPVPGNPRETIYYPQFGNQPQQFAAGVIGMALQMFERQMAQGALQSGQVPTGKASAVRTFGTTSAILQQGDVRADQLLLRLFGGIRQLATNFHRMNRHLLPPGKEIQRLGWDGPREEGYVTIVSLDEIDADALFDMRPDFLNSNPAMLAQTLKDVLGLIGTPLAFQLGITDPQLFYNTVKDYVRALRLDPKRYSKRPQESGAPVVLAEEAIDMLMHGQLPIGEPMEGAAVHLKKLFAWVNQAEAFSLLPPPYVPLARQWLQIVSQLAQQERTVAAARDFQTAQLQGGAGDGGVPTTMAEPPAAEAAPTPSPAVA